MYVCKGIYLVTLKKFVTHMARYTVRFLSVGEKNSKRYARSSVYDHNLNPRIKRYGICIISPFCLRGAPWD